MEVNFDDVNRGDISRININGSTKIVKLVNEENAFVDILISKLAKYVGIRCPETSVVVKNGNCYLIVDEIDEIGKFYDASFYCDEIEIDEKYSLTDVWSQLESYFGDASVLMSDIVKIYLFDLLMMNFDRGIDNWGIKMVSEDMGEVWIFDNENSFNTEFGSSIYTEDDNEDLIKDGSIDEYLDYLKTELSTFLSVSDSSFKDDLVNMYNALTPELLSSTIKEVENEYSIRGDISVDNYNKVYDGVGGLLNHKNGRSI